MEGVLKMDKRGFTLIEAVIAMAILAVGLLAVMKMTSSYIRANQYNHKMSEAVVFAQDKMEQLRSYATSDRIDRFSVFDFDYLVSTQKDFTSVFDPEPNGGLGDDILVDGFLSGGAPNNGVPTAPPWTPDDQDFMYDVMYNDGEKTPAAGAAITTVSGDEDETDGIFTNQDTKDIMIMPGGGNAPEVFTVNRTWTVEPIPNLDPSAPGAIKPDYALLTVRVWWNDKLGNERDVNISSCLFRRQ
jgi:prepilin-type N-terminal cleavage/methylation domain-containing protein